MSYSVLTYGNPYAIHQADFWDDIRDLPHFCASSVMAQNLWQMYRGKDFGAFFWPLDELTRVAYPEWTASVELRIEQYIVVSNQIRVWKRLAECGPDENGFFAAAEHNKAELIEAVRLFQELDIDTESLHEDSANAEQKAFISLYRAVKQPGGDLAAAFRLNDDKLHAGLSALLLELIEATEKDEERRQTANPEEALTRQRRVRALNYLAGRWKGADVKRLVVHGIHQFQPLQLRLIAALEAEGVEIIFLYNYQPAFKTIYATWDQLYRLIGVDIRHDRRQSPMTPPENRASHDLACSLAQLFNGGGAVGTLRGQWIENARNVEVLRFESTTEMANYASEFLDEAIAKHGQAGMRYCEEKIYSTFRDADDLMRVYYPDYAGDRHFLAYPIGQFFLGLYQLWDEERLSIRADVEIMRSCLSSGVLGAEASMALLPIFDVVRPMIEDVASYDALLARLNKYRDDLRALRGRGDEMEKHLKRHNALFREECVREADIERLREFAVKLNEAAKAIFTDSGRHISGFREHFHQLQSYLRERCEHLADQAERDIVRNLLARFDRVAMQTSLDGSMDDLRQGLYYYLRQNDREEPQWMIRNFAQIEGDVLRSSIQEGATYHFAGLSDRLMSASTDELLPWPLTDEFVHTAYSPNALVFQLYYTALSSYKEFARYALFYGLYFNRANVRLSYVRHVARDEEEQFYFPLSILGLTPKAPTRREDARAPGAACEGVRFDEEMPQRFPLMALKQVDYLLCPEKFYYDYVCGDGILLSSEFLILQSLYNILIAVISKEFSGQKATDGTKLAIRYRLEECFSELAGYMPFLNEVNEGIDLRNRVMNYVENRLMQSGAVSRKAHDTDFMEMRSCLISGIYKADEEPGRWQDAFAAFVKAESVGSELKAALLLRQAEDGGKPARKRAIWAYLNGEWPHRTHVGDWCVSCAHRGLCLKPYRREKNACDDE